LEGPTSKTSPTANALTTSAICAVGLLYVIDVLLLIVYLAASMT